MASTACENQLNAQLQIIDTRLKAAEENIGVLAKAVGAVASTSITATGATPNQFTTALVAMFTQSGNAFAAGWQNFINKVPQLDADAIQGLAITAAVQALGAVGQYVQPFEMAAQQFTAMIISLQADIQRALNEVPPDLAEVAILTQQIADIEQAKSGLTSAMEALDNIAKCKSASLMISG